MKINFTGLPKNLPIFVYMPDFTTKEEKTINGNREGIIIFEQILSPFIMPCDATADFEMISKHAIPLAITGKRLANCLFKTPNIYVTPQPKYMPLTEFLYLFRHIHSLEGCLWEREKKQKN